MSHSPLSKIRTKINRSGFSTPYDQENSFSRTHVHLSGEGLNLSINQSHNEMKAYLNQQSRDLLAEIQESQQRLTIQEMEDRLVMLATENERLIRLLNERERELQNQVSVNKHHQEEKLRVLEARTNKLILENEKVVQLNEELNTQISLLHANWEKIQIAHQIEIKELSEQYEFQLQSLTNELEAIKRDGHEQIMFHQQKNMQLIQSIDQLQTNIKLSEERITHLTKKIEILVDENQKTTQIAEAKAQEVEKFHTEKNRKDTIVQQSIQQYQQNIQNYQNKINVLQEEIVKMSNQMQEVMSDYEKTSQELQTQTNMAQEYYQYYQQLINVENMLKQVQAQNDEYCNQVIQLQNTIQNAEHQHQRQQEESLQKINSITVVLNKEREQYKHLQFQMEQLLTENSKLNSAFHERLNEIQIWQQRYASFENQTNIKHQQQNTAFELRIQEVQHQITISFKDVINQKDREIQGLTERINLLINQIDLLAAETQKAKQNYSETQQELDQFKPRLAANQKELDRLRHSASQKDEENERLRQQIIKLQSNYEIQSQEQHTSVLNLQHTNEQTHQELVALRQQKQELKRQLEEASAGFAQTSTQMSEAQVQIKQLQQAVYQKDQELAQLRPTLQNFKSVQKQEIDHLKKQYEQAIKIRVEREVALERERHIKYQMLWDADKKNLECRVQSLNTENEILKSELMNMNVHYRETIHDMKENQNRQIMNVSQAYSLELKGLTHVQQLEFQKIIQRFQSENAQSQKETYELRSYYEESITQLEHRYKLYIEGLEDRLYALEKDNKRLIDEKVEEVTRNSHLETKIRRLTPASRGQAEYVSRHGRASSPQEITRRVVKY